MEEKFKVMIVEDVSAVRRLVEQQIKEIAPCDVLEAEDGIVAVDLLTDDPKIDLMLLDMNMPRMGGIEVLEWVRSNPETSHIHIIMVTTAAERIKVVTALKKGANNYIIKPFKKVALQEKIEAFIASR